MDWSQLESLKIADNNLMFLRKMMDTLASLASLKLGANWTNE